MSIRHAILPLLLYVTGSSTPVMAMFFLLATS